jgi:hypothetical protein
LAKWVEERRRTGAHRRRRTRPGELADARNSDERFIDLGNVSGREEKGARERCWGLLIAGLGMEEG